jgi:hypothetical protein
MRTPNERLLTKFHCGVDAPLSKEDLDDLEATDFREQESDVHVLRSARLQWMKSQASLTGALPDSDKAGPDREPEPTSEPQSISSISESQNE